MALFKATQSVCGDARPPWHSLKPTAELQAHPGTVRAPSAWRLGRGGDGRGEVAGSIQPQAQSQGGVGGAPPREP